MADNQQIAENPRSASVRLRAVELNRELPQRWRERFEQMAVEGGGRDRRASRGRTDTHGDCAHSTRAIHVKGTRHDHGSRRG